MVINHAEMLDGRVAVVEVEGPLDSRTSPDFEEYIHRLLEKNLIFILFDAGKVEYVSSEGIGLLIYLQKKISEANGFFVIFNIAGEIMTLYRLLGFDKVFRIADSRAEALQVMDRQMEMRERGETEERPAEDAIAGVSAVREEPVPVPEEAGFEEIPVSPPVDTGLHDEAPAGTPQKGTASRVMKCSSCGTGLRVHNAGDYLCPKCNAPFSVPEQGGTPGPLRPAVTPGAFSPLIVECAGCRSLVRVKMMGAYSCPDCGKRFTVSKDQSVTF